MNLAFFSKEASLKLKHAILLYEADANTGSPAATHATMHSVDTSSGRPIILPGRLATSEDLKTLTKGMSASMQAAGTHWIDSSVLANGGGRMIWFTPAGKRSMFFQKCSLEGSFDAQGVAPVPALIWLAERDSLYVFAVKDSERPTPDTELFQAPFFNVWARGQVCIGTAQRPSESTVSDPKAWEAMFWSSRFTHPNFKEKNRLIEGVDPYLFWSQMLKVAPPQFPLEHLVPLKLKVADLLPIDAASSILNRMSATGEF
jgi:PRTRC genetic system protein B